MERPVLVFLVNGDAAGAMGIRARSFRERLKAEFRIEIAYRSANKLQAIWQLFRVDVYKRQPSFQAG